MDELKEAAIIAERCLAANLRQHSVNAISQNDIKSLNDTIQVLAQKVENLNAENQQLKTQF